MSYQLYTLNMKNILFCFMLSILPFGSIYSQDAHLKEVQYSLIAEGVDSPIPNLQIVCFNKYFNQDYLPKEFREKYNLDEKGLYKNQMLIEIFYTDTDNKGVDTIDLIKIKENTTTLVIEYNLVNRDKSNDDTALSPFLIVQVPKTKKAIKFIADGIELGKETALYVD